IYDFLRGFHDATIATEGRESTIEKVLPIMDFLLAKYEKAMRDFKDNTFILHCLKTGWEKLDKYYCLSDLTPVYIAAIVLHPEMKFNYLNKRWPKKWPKEARKKVKDFWNAQYKSTVISLPQQPSEETSDESPNEC